VVNLFDTCKYGTYIHSKILNSSNTMSLFHAFSRINAFSQDFPGMNNLTFKFEHFRGFVQTLFTRSMRKSIGIHNNVNSCQIAVPHIK